MEKIRLICRNSKLSVAQVSELKDLLPELDFEVIPTASYGDKHKEISLLENFDPDIFTRELDLALIEDEADVAVHSAKDLPYPLPPGIEIIALSQARHTADALVSKNHEPLDQLESGSVIGTSSPSRRDQLLKYRPDLQVRGIRGNIEERLQLMQSGEIDALIVAECALVRLGYESMIAEILPFETHPLQGKLAITAKMGNHWLKGLFYPIDERRFFGKVFLAGAGPGKKDLLTLRTVDALKKADIIFHDALVDNSLIDEFPCQKVFAGKRNGQHSLSQEEINLELYQAALAGKQVVRLKGGDPLIFGRGGEEFDFLRSRMIEVEIIPGITTASAAAASLGISITHREESSSLAFCTGYPLNSIQVPDADTLVYYMGSTNSKQIAQKLIEKGKSSATPATLISHVSLPQQQVLYTDLEELSKTTIDLPTPLLIIIGKVARYKNLPVRNDKIPKILVTGTRVQKFLHLGEIIHNPVIELSPLEDYAFIQKIVPGRSHFSGIVFTSRFAVRFFFTALLQQSIDRRKIANSRIFSIGETTTAELRKHGIFADHQAEDESAEGIIKLFKELGGLRQNLLLPRSNIAPDYLPDSLRKLGHGVTAIPVYRNALPKTYVKTRLDNIDILTFSSPSGVRNFIHLYKNIPKHIQIITLGYPTQQAVIEHGFGDYLHSNKKASLL